MSGDIESEMIAAGSALAGIFCTPPPESRPVRFGTVAAVSGTRLDVSVGGATLKALPMTTSCAGAKAGDRCIVNAVGPIAVVTGIIAK
jgi:hypothetical protein